MYIYVEFESMIVNGSAIMLHHLPMSL